MLSLMSKSVLSVKLSTDIIQKMFRILLLFFLLAPLSVHAGSFPDVPESREEYEAVENLKTRGIINGNPDGTFGPDAFVNRAEAITIVVRAVANAKNLPPADSCFPDVNGEDWYVKPVCYARDLGWVAGYPNGTFQPVRTVSKAEFLKILLNAYGVDVNAIEVFTDPVAPDAANPDEWYFPFLSYALASSMTSADSFGNLNPGIALTRGQVALLMYRYLIYKEGGRTQELLLFAEKDIRAVFSHLDELEIDKAKFAASRIRLATWGAKQKLPDAEVVLVTEKLSESLRELTDAYKLLKGGAVEVALEKAQLAYRLSDEADLLSGTAVLYTSRVKSYAHELANDIRAYLSTHSSSATVSSQL